jgi:hypothetical protein
LTMEETDNAILYDQYLKTKAAVDDLPDTPPKPRKRK